MPWRDRWNSVSIVSITRRDESARISMSDRKERMVKSSPSAGRGETARNRRDSRTSRIGVQEPRGFPSLPEASRSRESHIGPFPLRGRLEPEELFPCEAEQEGDKSRGEGFGGGVVVPDDGVVVAAGILDAVLELRKLLLQREEAFARLEVGVALSQREE